MRTYKVFLKADLPLRTLQASTTKKISVALQCATMNKILEPKSAFSVSPVSRTNSYCDKKKTLDMTQTFEY